MKAHFKMLYIKKTVYVIGEFELVIVSHTHNEQKCYDTSTVGRICLMD